MYIMTDHSSPVGQVEGDASKQEEKDGEDKGEIHRGVQKLSTRSLK